MSGFRQALRVLVRLMTASEYSLQRAATSWRVPSAEPQNRALQLLIDNLSPSQREQYQTHRYFDVIGGDTGKRYRIRHGYQMNVEELDEKGRRFRLLCFLPEGGVPLGDVMLAQKIALEVFESDTMRVAHRSPTREDMATAGARIVWRDLRF
jgi:hypothetical protein